MNVPTPGGAAAAEVPAAPIVTAPDLGVTIGGLRFPVPVLAAPGPLGFGREVRAVMDLRAFGGFITKSVTVEPRPGHSQPDIAAVEGGWLNSVGLRNPGIGAFVHRDLPFLRTLGIPIIVSIAGHTVEEFQQLVEVLEDEAGVDAVEVNVSCPNVRAGRRFGSDPGLVAGLLARLRPMMRRPLFVKLSPLGTEIVAVARAAAEAGADAFCCVNTIPALAIDVETRRPVLGAGPGGLSGPAIRPVAVWTTWRVARATGLPVIGAGGVGSARDAIEFLLAGARAVAVASALISDPEAAGRIADGLRAYLQAHAIASIDDLIGGAVGLEEVEDDRA